MNARMDDRQCLLVIVGADEFGKKELVAVQGGIRECEHSWREVLLDLKQRGLLMLQSYVLAMERLAFGQP